MPSASVLNFLALMNDGCVRHDSYSATYQK
jgi:hypothetical protein